MVSARTVSVILRAEIGKFRADMQTAGQVASEAARKTETAWDKSTSSLGRATQAIQQHSGELTTAGTVLAGFGTVVVGSLGLATKAAMSWESAWTGVLKTVDGTPKQLAAVEEGLRGLAKTLPATHGEIAAVAEAAGQLGIHTDNVVAFTKTMIDMGESTNLSAEEAATGLARFSNIMRTPQKDVGRLGAAIVGLGNNFATTEAEILGMSMRIAGAGKQAGLTEGDVLGLATALSSVGIEAEAGGTAISMVMKKITNSVAAGDDRLALFAETAGMTSEQFSKAWTEDPSAAMTTFVEGLGKADAAGQNVNETLSALGVTGVRESDALLRLSSNAELLESAFKTGNDEFERGTALAEEAAKRYETAESKMKMAGNSIKDTAITIGGMFLPVVAEGMEAVAGFADIVGKVPEPLLRIVSGVAGAAGAFSLLAGGALILIPRLAETYTAFQTLHKSGIIADGTMAKITTTSGRVATGLGRVKSLAAGAALGLTAVAATSGLFNKWGETATKATGETAEALQALTGQMSQGSIDVGSLNAAFTDLVSTKGDLGEFGNAVNEVINPNAWGVMDDVVTDATRFISLGMVDMTSSTEEARARFATLGEQLATLASTDAVAAQTSFQQMVAETDGSAEAVSNLIDLMPAYKDQLTEQATALGLATDNTTLAKLAMGEIQPNAQGASDAIGGMGDAAETTAESLTKMLDGLLALGLATLSERDAMRQYEEAVDGIAESIKENGTTLDITTEKGRANEAAFDAIASAGMRAAQSMAENGSSQEEVQGHLQQTYDDLIAAAGQFGVTGDKAHDMAREVMGIPDGVDIETWMSDAAEEQAKNTKDAVNDIPRKVSVAVHFTVNDGAFRNFDERLVNPNHRLTNPADPLRKVSGRGPGPWKPRASGGIDLMPMAQGGMLSNIAQMVPPNTWRVVGDRMDVDEAFIPLDGSRRSWRILAESMRRMPGVMPMARGGITSADRKREQERKREEARREAEQRAREERERRDRVRALQTDLRADLRRSSVRSQITGGLSGGYSAVDRMLGLGKNEDLSKGARSTASSSARRFEANLRRLYGQAEKLDERLKDAKDKASELEGIQKSVASGLTNDRQLNFSTSTVERGGNFYETTSYAGLGNKAARVSELAGKIRKLARAGFPGGILQEIVSLGIEGGNDAADALLNAPVGDQRQLIRSWADFDQAASDVGAAVTEGFHKGGVNAAQGLVKGLESQKKSIENQIASLARQMESTFKQVLGIRSPSTVMAELGAHTAEGLTVGIMSQLGGIQAAATAMADAAIPSMDAIPVTVGDLPEASTVMADMSGQTLTAMQAMRDAVSLSMTEQQVQTETSQQGMATATQLAQQTMGTATQTSQAQARQATTAEQATMLTTVQTSQAGMLADTRLRQSEMLTGTRASFAQMRQTGITETQTLRNVNAATQSGMRSDHSAHMSVMRDVNRSGFHSMRDTGVTAFRGLRDGMHGQMQAARPVLGSDLNRLIGVLGRFTKEVNSAFGDVGVKLSAPKPLAFREGGTLPGYTPRRDVHTFYSPTGGIIEASGGESFMVPEWTRAMGGPAAIKEQNRAARQGRLDDLLHMQTQQFADGGVWRNLWAMTKAQFPNARLTSAYRPGSITASGNRSYHARRMAIDVSPSMDIFNWWRNNYGAQLAELIFSPAGGKQIKNGRNYMYTGAVRSMHYNHVHIAAVKALSEAMAGGLPGFGGFDGPMYPFLDKVGVSAGANLEKAYRDAAAKHLTRIRKNISLDGLNPTMRQLARGIMDEAAGGLADKAAKFGKTAGAGDFSNVANGPIKQMARQMLEAMGWGDQWDDLNWLVQRESSWNPNAQNPRSTAYGLFQFLNGTWSDVGGSKTSDPKKQIEYGLKYIRQRYGDVRGARRFWERNNWYAGGTQNSKGGWAVVGEDGPELINLQPGHEVKSNAETRAMLAEYRSVIPDVDVETLRHMSANAARPVVSVDPDAIGRAVAAALPSLDADVFARALDGRELTLVVDGKQMAAHISSTVGRVAVDAGRSH